MKAFDDLGLLRAFVCIVECANISAAARRLKISQPALSRQLRTLEEHCGASLLRRDTHRMSVTETGHRLLADARAMLGYAEEAEHRLREDHAGLGGNLRLFATIDLGQWVVTPILGEFLRRNPRVTATLGLGNRPLHMIQEGCDVGIVPGKITDESVIARPAGGIALRLAASPTLINQRSAVTSLADLKSWPWLSLAGSQFWNAREITLFCEGEKQQMLRFEPVLISEGVTSIREAARAGLGIALLPEWLIKDEIASGELAYVLPRWRPRELPVHVVYLGQRALPARVSAFIEFAVAALAGFQRRGGALEWK